MMWSWWCARSKTNKRKLRSWNMGILSCSIQLLGNSACITGSKNSLLWVIAQERKTFRMHFVPFFGLRKKRWSSF